MPHILDNPIWNALRTGNKQFAFGSEQAAYIKRDAGLFAGLKNNSEEDLAHLHTLFPENGRFILFTPEAISIAAGWQVELKKPLMQMIYLHRHRPFGKDTELVPLQDKDIPAMLDLTEKTNPGPFLARTIDFGNYEGIFNGGSLVAMAGQRLQPELYTEVSAVCTLPGHTGKGYAAKLILSQINKITASNRVPILHVFPDNTVACRLYEKLGFETRREMLVYILEKTNVDLNG